MNVNSTISLTPKLGGVVYIDYNDIVSIESASNGSKVILKHHALTIETTESPKDIMNIVLNKDTNAKKLREIARNLELKYNEVIDVIDNP